MDTLLRKRKRPVLDEIRANDFLIIRCVIELCATTAVLNAQRKTSRGYHVNFGIYPFIIFLRVQTPISLKAGAHEKQLRISRK